MEWIELSWFISGHIQWCASIIRRCMSIVPSSVLQVDIYVTSFKPVLLKHPTLLLPPRTRLGREPTKSDEELQPPHPNFVREDSIHLRSRSTESVESHESDVDLSYYLGESSDDEPPADEMGIAHETNILDLTNFDGDVDMALPGEAYFSRRLKKEGKLRRMKSHKRAVTERMGQGAQSSQPLAYDEARTPRRAQDPRQAYPDQHRTPSRSSHALQPRNVLMLSTQSTDRQLTITPLSERSNSPSSETDSYSSLRPYSPLKSMPLSSEFPSAGGRRSPAYPAQSCQGVKSESGKSGVGQLPLLTTNVYSDELHSAILSSSTLGISDSQHPFQMDEQEATDVSVISEHARPGKPKLDKVIADEVQASKGTVIIACQSIFLSQKVAVKLTRCLARLRAYVSECNGTRDRCRADRSWADTQR